MCHIFNFNACRNVRCNYEKRKEIIGYNHSVTSVREVKESAPQRQDKWVWLFGKGRWPIKTPFYFGGKGPKSLQN